MKYVHVKEADGSGDMIRVTLEPNDPVLESLMSVAEDENIEAAAILEGSSMVKGPIRLGWYDFEKDKFGSFRNFKDQVRYRLGCREYYAPRHG